MHHTKPQKIGLVPALIDLSLMYKHKTETESSDVVMGLSPLVKFVSHWLPGDRLGRELPDHLPHCDGGVEGAPRQCHGRAGGLRL